MKIGALIVSAACVAVTACSAAGGPTAAPSTEPAGTATAAAASATTGAAPTQTQAPSTTSAPSPSAAETTVAPTVAATPSPASATDLVALIPDQVGDIVLDEPLSFSGQEYVDAATGGVPQNVEAFNDFIAQFGRSVDDLSGATTSGFSESGDYVYVTANRVAGADPALLLSETVQFTLDSIPNFNSGMAGTATQLTLGGKPVTKVVTVLGESMVYDTSYYYGYGDIVFKVSGINDEVVAEALSLLP